MPELLIEFLSEEIPARMQVKAAEELQRLVTGRLTAAGLGHDRAEAQVTPRRLALVVEGLPRRTDDVRDERKGPRVGAPEAAVQGFLKSAGLDRLDQCEQREVGKARFWFAVIDRPGRDARAVLPGLIQDVIRAMPWPKSMRWSSGTCRWVRPLQGILIRFDGATLDGAFDPGGGLPPLVFGSGTVGHRFMAPDGFTVEDFADYRDKLRAAAVILSHGERRAVIADRIAALAAAEGLGIVPDPGLLDEVAGLVEWPVAHLGDIDRRFMDLPPEVLTTSMRSHQKYFALANPDGSLAPRFAVVANRVTSDGGAAVVAGNERVLRARLSDARFFWDQDRRTRLEDRLPALADVTFHARLGTLAAKTGRVEALAAAIAGRLGLADPGEVRLAARLAKADLVTGMVGEFPELQGLMGRYYALGEGLPPAVADAIADHYRPLGPSDACPAAPVSVAVALADKIDTLAGFFLIDEKPTGSKDPYALRRAALGLIRLVLDNRLRLPLLAVFREAATAHIQGAYGQGDADATARALLAFVHDRLTVALREAGIRHDLIAAVAGGGAEDDLVRLRARAEAIQGFLGTADGADLLTAYRRASNIVRIEARRDGAVLAGPPDPDLLDQPEERALHDALAAADRAAAPLIAAEDHTAVMAVLAELRAPVDAFFDRVTVNADRPEIRANRLRMLGRIHGVLDTVADFSGIEA